MTTQDDLLLSGQVAAVTGGGRGIGRAIAARLSAAGATTAVLARSSSEINETARMIEEAGGHARPFVVDVTDTLAVEKTFVEIERTLGSVTLLVNNAAIPGPIGPFWETDPERWWRTLDVNLRGAMLCSHAVLPGMIASGKGRIINIASSAIPVAYFSSYATSKAALVRFTETIAGELKPYGVSTFAVGPGTVRTSMAEHSLRSDDGQKWLPWFKRIFNEGLDVSVERPARLVLELASGRTDSLSGRFLSIWDDLDLLLQNVREIEERHLYSLRVQTLDGSGVGSALTAIRTEAEQPLALVACAPRGTDQETAPAILLRIERGFAAPRDKVFGLWTDPQAVAKWFLPPENGHWTELPTFEAQPGGSFRLRLVASDESYDLHGTFREARAPEKLVLNWRWDKDSPLAGSPGNTEVTVEFFAHEGRTDIVLSQTGFRNEESRGEYERGWHRCFRQMDKLIDFVPPEAGG